MKDLLERLRKSTPSIMDNSIPRMPRAMHVVRISSEERDFLVELVEDYLKSPPRQTADTTGG